MRQCRWAWGNMGNFNVLFLKKVHTWRSNRLNLYEMQFRASVYMCVYVCSVGQISTNSGGNSKRLARNIFEAYFDRWFRKRVSADAFSWYQISKLGSSIIDFHSDKFLWHENNDFSNFSIWKILERPLKHELRMGAWGDFFRNVKTYFISSSQQR